MSKKQKQRKQRKKDKHRRGAKTFSKTTRRTVTKQWTETRNTPAGEETRRIHCRTTTSIEICIVRGRGPYAATPESDTSSFPAGNSGDETELAGLPRRWKLSVTPVTHADGSPAPEIDGDYILDRVYCGRQQARWEQIFPQQHGLYRATLEIRLSEGDLMAIQAEFSGANAGPIWTATVASLRPGIVLESAQKKLLVAGFQWPRCIEVTPLAWSRTQTVGETQLENGDSSYDRTTDDQTRGTVRAFSLGSIAE